jgi:hypothetical protein
LDKTLPSPPLKKGGWGDFFDPPPQTPLFFLSPQGFLNSKGKIFCPGRRGGMPRKFFTGIREGPQDLVKEVNLGILMDIQS